MKYWSDSPNFNPSRDEAWVVPIGPPLSLGSPNDPNAEGGMK